MNRDLTKGPVIRTILLFAVPMILGDLLQQCYNIADTLIVGQFLGRNALAAVGSVFTLMTFLTSVILGLCMGSGALFSFTTVSHLFLRAIGNSVVPLVFLAVSSVLNIVLDLWFVVGLHKGVAGAAQATVIAQYLSGVGIAVISLGTRVALAYLLSAVSAIGVVGIWWSVPIGWALADLVGFVYYKRHAASFYNELA